MHAWAQTEEASEYVERSSIAGTPGGGSASTPAEPAEPKQLKAAQRERKLKGYFKTHAFYAYGGLLWLKFLVATGNVDVDAVDAVNNLCALHTLDRRGIVATNVPDSTPGNFFLRREDRASTPVASESVVVVSSQVAWLLDSGLTHAPIHATTHLLIYRPTRTPARPFNRTLRRGGRSGGEGHQAIRLRLPGL